MQPPVEGGSFAWRADRYWLASSTLAIQGLALRRDFEGTPSMEKFSKLLEQFMADPTIAVQFLFDNYQAYEQPASIDELRDFLTFLSLFVRKEIKKQGGEAKSLSDPRSKGIQAILDWLPEAQENSPAFSGVKLIPFAYQLALRVRKPALIEQSSTALCGAVALLYSFAKLTPEKFAKLGMDLYQKGVGLFNELVLDPTPKIKTGFTGQKLLGEVDYVLLTSLRQCGDVSNLGGSLNVPNETLTAGSICSQLRLAGYKDVTNSTFINVSGFALKLAEVALGQKIYDSKSANPGADAGDKAKMLLNLQRASNELAKGRFVLMMGHGEISEAIKAKKSKIGDSEPSALDRTLRRHWTAVRKIDVQTKDEHNKTVSLRIITWGKRYDGQLELDNFLAHYEGFVSATP